MKLKKVLVALGFAYGSLTLIVPTPSKAEGGCPKGFFPIGGGYCRNIVCPAGNQYNDWDTEPTMKKYGYTCPVGIGQQWNVGKWGNQTIPMR